MKRVLFISFDFHPHKGVSSFRNSYWAQNLMNASNHEMESYVVTSKKDAAHHPDNANIKKIFYVPIAPSRPLFSYLVEDEGLLWKKNLINFIKNHKELMPSVVIITGSPFMHFSITKQIKAVWKSKVILDFRDPFANNPSFGISKFKSKIKSLFENYWISLADQILVINSLCKNLLTQSPEVLNKSKIISNGFDERQIRKIPPPTEQHRKLRLIYPGRLLSTYNFQNVLTAISNPTLKDQIELFFLGKKDAILQSLDHPSNFIFHDEKDAIETLQYIQNADIGLIMRGENLFSSTTKVYDYIALNKPILVVSGQDETQGPLHQILQNYPCVVYSKNNPQDIALSLQQFLAKKLNFDYPDKMQFSREHGLKQLIQIIKELI